MFNFETFSETLPSKIKFHNALNGKVISDKGYQHVLKVTNKFEIKTMEDYCDLYLKCNILSLADVSEKFRNGCLENYGLCSSHYLSVPALSWLV